MVVVPAARVDASPLLRGVLDTVANAGDVELQVTVLVRSWVVESVNVPVARNCCGRPAATVAVGGEIDRAFNTAVVTVSVAVPVIAP